MALPHRRKVLVNHHQRRPVYSVLISVTRRGESFMSDVSFFGQSFNGSSVGLLVQVFP